MSDSEATSALKAQIRALQNDLNDVRAENNLLKMKVHANDPLIQPQPLHSREIKVEFKTGVTEMRSATHNADGVEMSVKLEKIVKKESAYERNLKFAVTLYVKNLDPSQKRFALTTMEVKERERYSHDNRRLTTLMKPVTQRFVLCSSGDQEEAGHKKTFLSQQSESASVVDFVVVVTLAVQSIASMDLDDGSETTVIVKGKEFSVSAQYLSLWSAYFRAYFNADMKEKKTGKYPIKDKDITPKDFEELLMVIYPTDKPITTHNYRNLLRLASRFEMPELTRRIELFLIDFERNELERAGVFRLATDTFSLKLVQSTLLHRWRDSNLLQCELLKTAEYEKLKTETKALINERFAQACIKKDAHSSAESSHHEDSMNDDDDEDEDSPYFDEAEDDDYLNDSDDPYNLH